MKRFLLISKGNALFATIAAFAVPFVLSLWALGAAGAILSPILGVLVLFMSIIWDGRVNPVRLLRNEACYIEPVRVALKTAEGLDAEFSDMEGAVVVRNCDVRPFLGLIVIILGVDGVMGAILNVGLLAAAVLSLIFATLAYLLWIYFDLTYPRQDVSSRVANLIAG